MKIDFNNVLYAFSYALDCVERELVGVSDMHSKRVAYISAVLSKHLGLIDDEITDIAACSILHDNALTQYIQSEYENNVKELKELKNTALHCSIGEKNIKNLPFKTDIKNAVLYHHENADGSGAFGKNSSETPLAAQIIHIADTIDANFDLSKFSEQKYAELIKFLDENKNKLFEDKLTDIFVQKFKKEDLLLLQRADIDELLKSVIPERIEEYDSSVLKNIADLFAKITDYKSQFTSRHSLGIAKKAAIMASFYGYDYDTIYKLYFAGAVHDIGKLVIANDVLEKPDKLTDSEYVYMQTHAWYTYDVLSKIKGFEDITRWASYHHEKLNGEGYPFKKTAAELDKNERLMACLDIYQALTEKRPYKDGMTHSAAVKILYNMSEKNFIDTDVTKDIDHVFGELQK